MSHRPVLVAVVGPTAVGKSQCALRVAEKLGGEIVSADSMQIYRGMDIGTAKPTPEDRACVPHHLIDIVEPDEPYNVARYARDAHEAISGVLQRGRLPILVGGSGLYVRAVTGEVSFPMCEPNAMLRRELTELAEREGRATVHARLAAVDPESAARIKPNDLKRIIRAIEVYQATGRKLSESYRSQVPGTARYAVLMFGLTCDRQRLYERIERRVDRMLALGLQNEVRRLLERGYGPELQAMQAIGYKEMAEYLLGRTSLAEAERLLRRNTRRLAKRQLTWFRADARVAWIDMLESDPTAVIVDAVAKHSRSSWQMK